MAAATYHGPGQLVGYPITDLNRCGRDLHNYVTALENALIEACSQIRRTGPHPGRFGGRMGGGPQNSLHRRRVKKWIAMHGFAFNVTRESLPPFQAITPCGIQGVQMTCLEQEMPESGQKDDLLDRFGNAFATLWKEKFHRNSKGAECAGEHEKSFFP